MNERDKFLTEVMGECWHSVAEKQPYHDGAFINICRCGERASNTYILTERPQFHQNTFSTWPGFGKLWEWAAKQEWWIDFLQSIWTKDEFFNMERDMIPIEFIHPDRFADTLYEFLKDRTK